MVVTLTWEQPNNGRIAPMDGLIITHSSTDTCTKNALATMLTLNHVEMTAAAWRRQHRSRPRGKSERGSKGDMKVKVIIRLARRTEGRRVQIPIARDA